MSHATRLIAAIVCLIVSGCAESALSTLQGLYGVPLPANVKIVRYYGESVGMDPSFAWVLSPIDDPYLKQLIASRSLKALRAGEEPPSAVYSWPRWWDQKKVGSLFEVYFDDSNGLRRIWVDRANDRLYIEFIGT